MEPLAIAYLMYSFILYYYSTSIHHFSRQLHIEHLMPTLIGTIGPLAMQYTLYLKQQKASGIGKVRYILVITPMSKRKAHGPF